MINTKEYKVLARKYRPKKFSDLIGQDLLVEIITSSIFNDRLAHAYLLTGVRGVGKTTTARLIAMSINCKHREPKTCEPCGDCDSCKSTGVDSNLDVIEMDAASNTGVDDVREIIENVKYKPIIGKYKVFIVDEVHMLSKSAFNALLKTLEEPPSHVIFIFATTEVKKIPITVLSRCQRFDLHRVKNNLLTEHLLNISKLENIEIDQDAVSLIVRSADGSVRDGLSLLDQALNNQEKKIDSKSIIAMLGLAEREKIYYLLEKILLGDAVGALDDYKNLYELGADVNMIFDELLNVVHFITQIKISPKLKDDIYIPELERLKGFELSNKLSMNNLNIIWQILFKGYQELQNGIHLFQHGEMIILRIIYLYNGDNPDDLLKKLNLSEKTTKDEQTQNNNQVLKHKDENKILNFDKNTNTQINNEKSKKNKNSINNFRQFVDMFYRNREGILHAQLYNDVILITFKEGEIEINIDKIEDKNFIRTITKLISKWTGRIWQVHSSTSNIGKSLFDEDIINQQREIEVMKNHPDIKKILDTFSQSKIHSITDLMEVNKNEEFNETKKIKKEQ